MKKNLRLFMLALLCAVVGTAWGAESVFYTLTPADYSTSGSSNYATATDYEYDGITWNVTANSSINPWRFGGKNLDAVDRPLFSKTAMGSAITKVEVETGSITLTVNSFKLIVSSDADFNTVIDNVTATCAANSTITFTPTSGTEWATGAYYKFVFNVTAGGSNSYVQFNGAKFYKNGNSVTVAVPTFDPVSGTEMTAGSKVTIKPATGCTLSYTVNGGVAQTSSGNAEVTINEDTEIKAKCIDGNGNESSEVTANYTIKTATPTQGYWVKVDPSTLATDDYVVIVDMSVTRAMSNNEFVNNKCPRAISINLNTDRDKITSEVGTGIQWKVTKTDAGYLFGVPGLHTYLYCTNSNDGVRVGHQTDNNHVFSIEEVNSKTYLFNNATSRYLGIYETATDWRCYTSVNANINHTNTAFFRYVEGENNRVDPGYSFSDETAEVTLGVTPYELPSFDNPNGVDVTFASSDEEVAAFDETGTLNIVGVGMTIISATSLEDETYFAGNASYTLTVVPRTVDAPEFSIPSGKVDANTTVTITGPENTFICYTTNGEDPDPSSDEISTSNEVEVTITETVTIKAIAISDDYEVESEIVTATYTVVDPNADREVWVLVESEDDLVLGEEYIIAAVQVGNQDDLMVAMGEQKTNNRAAVDLYVSGDPVPTEMEFTSTDVQIITLEGDPEGWYFNVGDGYLYAANSSKNILKTQAESDENAKALITFTEDGEADIVFQGEFTRNQLRFNNNDNLFSCYGEGNSQTLVRLYHKTLVPTTETITSPNSPWITYCSEKDLSFADLDATPYIVTGMKKKANGSFSATIQKVPNKLVPANIGILIKMGDDMELHARIISPDDVADVDLSSNQLVGVTTDIEIPQIDGSKTNFVLYNGTNGLGFYKVKADGGTVKAHRAYLPLPTAKIDPNANVMFIDDDADAINDVEVAGGTDGAWYTLSGVRMAQPTQKGVYVNNGRKVVIK